MSERVAEAKGIVIAHEAFLGRWIETAHLLDALDKFRRLAATIPARDIRQG